MNTKVYPILIGAMKISTADMRSISHELGFIGAGLLGLLLVFGFSPQEIWLGMRTKVSNLRRNVITW
jgi:hypothetical protein